jgi:chemotaxis protein methyltransferase CheR
MKDSECVEFLQWALPRLHMRWAGFRKIRSRVCKRVQRRINQLQFESISTYQEYLRKHPEEWQKLDELCRVTISRFYRDKMVFSLLELEVLPVLAGQALSCDEDVLHIWSAGCASGEEPYTLMLVWDLSLQLRFPRLRMHILATDTDSVLLKRAEQACYTFSSVKNLPAAWRETAFLDTAGVYCLDPVYKRSVDFQCEDIREALPDGPFDLILCRNLVFTYFDPELQTIIRDRMWDRLKPGGALVTGVHEVLQEGKQDFEIWSARLGIYRKGRTNTRNMLRF